MPMNRQTAYLNHETLPTPSDDPTIWKKLNPVYLSDKRHVGCQCSYTFHLAEPVRSSDLDLMPTQEYFLTQPHFLLAA